MMIKLPFLPSFLTLYRNIKNCVTQVVLRHYILWVRSFTKTLVYKATNAERPQNSLTIVITL